MSLWTRNLLPKSTRDRIATHSMRASYAAWHLCMSLLASREGATDELIIECRDALADAIISTALAGLMADTIRAERPPGNV